ncbi:MAG TPA: hypothetical protein VF212_04220 [Longimicrobiales bacterium]
MSRPTGSKGESPPETIPLGQKLYDNWVLLMIAGIVIMTVVYTGWGIWEVVTMPPATLP